MLLQIMAIDILISALRSRRMRSRIVGAASTIRTIGGEAEDKEGGLGDLIPDGLKKFFGGALGKFLNFAGFLLKGLASKLQFSATRIMGFLHTTVTFLYNFNWNASDKDLDRIVESINTRIAGQLGSTLGNFTGYLACGIIPAAGIFTFNEAMGLYLLKEVGEEALDELMGNLQSLLQTTLTGLAQKAIINKYKNLRRFVKFVFNDPNSPQSKLFKQVFGGNFNNAVKGWGAEGSQPWSFAQKVEEAVESIPDPRLRAFTEEFLEELGEGCIEAGYVLAGGLDSWILQQRNAKTALLGKERTVEIKPDRETEGETIILSGPEELLKPQIVQTMANYQLVANRDMGQIIAQQAIDVVAKLTQERQLHIIFKGKSKPPWVNLDGDAVLETEATVRGLEKGLKWKEIKLAAKHYTWGKFKASALMSDGQQMHVWGATSEGAVAKFKDLAELSTLTYTGINVTEEVERNVKVKKEPTEVYPAFCTLLVKRISHDTTGRLDVSGRKWKQTPIRIDLWPDEEPPGFDGVLDDLAPDNDK